MTTTMTLPMAEMPAAISESVACVLKAHGLTLSTELLTELGRNCTQALFSIDQSVNAPEVPSTADRLAVGQTLRMLARTAPGEGTREALWIDLAIAAIGFVFGVLFTHVLDVLRLTRCL